MNLFKRQSTEGTSNTEDYHHNEWVDESEAMPSSDHSMKRSVYNVKIDRFLTNGIIVVGVLLICVLLVAFLI